MDEYTQGQQWYDGCDFKCTCEDAEAGIYRCNQRYIMYYCTLWVIVKVFYLLLYSKALRTLSLSTPFDLKPLHLLNSQHLLCLNHYIVAIFWNWSVTRCSV